MNEETLERQYRVLRSQTRWSDLYFYQKTNVLYLLTFDFAKRYLHQGDRTIDQMVQAARSGKQNIVEGAEDGATSMEMEIKLMNVARSSIHELREDYEDYLKGHSLPLWDNKHPRFDGMLSFCREHNDYADYEKLAEKMSAEEFCNMAITVCRMTDKMLVSYLEHLEQRFVTEGGIKERMHSARTGYRQEQDAKFAALEEENRRLKEILKQHGIAF